MLSNKNTDSREKYFYSTYEISQNKGRNVMKTSNCQLQHSVTRRNVPYRSGKIISCMPSFV